MPRKVFVAGEILTAADVNTNLMDQAVMVFGGTATRGSAIPSPSEGMVTYLEDVNQVQAYDGSGWNAVSKILQVVVGTDSTDRTTSSTSFTDANISVTITPSSASNSVLLFWNAVVIPPSGNTIRLAITDSSNNTLTGGERMSTSSSGGSLAYSSTSIATDTPGTTSAVTYKGRFLVSGGSGTLSNANNTGMLIAMEVAA